MDASALPAAIAVDDALLRAWPLPAADDGSDKEERGRALVIAGSREMPGAAQLAAIAVLHAGAGKLAVATAASAAPGLALALPEARVIALPESRAGALTLEGIDQIEATLGQVDAVLVGPGLLDEDGTCAFVGALLERCGDAAVLLDALAMEVVRGRPACTRRVLLTPHAGEMAHLTGRPKEELAADAARAALDAARRWNAVVALKGAHTHVATAEGGLWRHDGAQAGLGTSGSGDVLAGLMTGLLARGASLEQAAVWGVVLHARAGRALARAHGPVGFLARELSAQVPRLMAALRSPGGANR